MGQYHKWPSGYLSFNGDFYEAPYYSHMATATKIVNMYELPRPRNANLDEDTLLLNGFICIRTSDVYKRARDYEGKILLISDKQQKYFSDNWSEFNDNQKKCILDLISDFGLLNQFYKEIGECTK